MAADENQRKLFASILSKDHNGQIFYKSQQIDEVDLDNSQKISILEELFREKPHIFLQRYFNFIDKEFISLFDENNSDQKYYLDLILNRKDKDRNLEVRNRRFLAMQKLRDTEDYFSNAKMREREPLLFDIMVGQYLDDSEKLSLRPTIEINESNRSEFSKLLEQLDESNRLTERRNQFLEKCQNFLYATESDKADRFLSHVDRRTAMADVEEQQIAEEFQMEFDTSDEEGQAAEKARINARRTARRSADSDGKILLRRRRGSLSSESERPASKTSQELRHSSVDAVKEGLSGIHVSFGSSVGKRRASNSAHQISDLENFGSPNCSKVSVQEQQQQEGDEEWSSGDEDEKRPTGFSREQLYEEFVSYMEERFLEGRDQEFFDYSRVDSGEGEKAVQSFEDRIMEQDMEDAYFDSEEPD